VASLNANPKIAYPNNSFFNEGFRPYAIISPQKTIPIPAPAPTNPIVAKPAPMFFELLRIALIHSKALLLISIYINK